MIEYAYWCEANPRPRTIPAGCETLIGDGTWKTTKTRPSEWLWARRRWPTSQKVELTETKETKKMISKEMYEKGLNRERRIYADLPSDVQSVIKQGTKQYYGVDLEWKDDAGSVCQNLVYRIHPDTKIEQEYEDLPIITVQMGTHRHYCITSTYLLSTAVNSVNFLGIVYTRDGIQTMRTSMDRIFGVPVFLRLAK